MELQDINTKQRKWSLIKRNVQCGDFLDAGVHVEVGIKDLSEMIRKKILKAAVPEIEKNELEFEIKSVEEDIETAYKEKIQCNLSNKCRVCGKRGCAAERFLEETHFFIEQYLDNFVES